MLYWTLSWSTAINTNTTWPATPMRCENETMFIATISLPVEEWSINISVLNNRRFAFQFWIGLCFDIALFLSEGYLKFTYLSKIYFGCKYECVIYIDGYLVYLYVYLLLKINESYCLELFKYCSLGWHRTFTACAPLQVNHSWQCKIFIGKVVICFQLIFSWFYCSVDYIIHSIWN